MHGTFCISVCWWRHTSVLKNIFKSNDAIKAGASCPAMRKKNILPRAPLKLKFQIHRRLLLRGKSRMFCSKTKGPPLDPAIAGPF